jgi:ABC-type polysaccharide/polyol phosphate export permease
MNTTISICAAALSALYQQVLAVAVMLFVYHALIHPLKIDQPVATFAMLLLAWFTGAAIGMVFMGFSPWAPTLVGLVNKGYVRISMFASGKMFVANMLPSQMRALFDWHPLFHIVDQARGFAFINYVPHFTAIGYPVRLALVCLAIGLLGEFYTRRRVSLSWSARGLGQ